VGWPGTLTGDRVLRSRAALAATRAQLRDWFDERVPSDRVPDDRYLRFAAHLATLDAVLHHMLDAVDAELQQIAAESLGTGERYERCRAADNRISLIRRTHEWYASKYDQRADARTESVLRSADEVIRSCWSEAFTAVGVQAPTGPLAYLEPRFDAGATPRVSVPPDLRAPDDQVVGEFVRELPIPVVALPDAAGWEPWWLVLAAHETGHHVQRDVDPALRAATADALLQATQPAADAGDEGTAVAADWQRWAMESFADAFAAFSVGSTGAWAVEELHHAAPYRLVTTPRPGDRYPPPAVRSALLGELARRAGAADPGPGAAEIRLWLDELPDAEVNPAARVAVARHLEVTPDVAAALAAIRVRDVSLPEVCGWTAQRFSAGGDVHTWADRLTRAAPIPVSVLSSRAAARLAVAGAVTAMRRLDGPRAATGTSGEPLEPDTPAREALRDRVLDVLPRCGPPGVLAGGPAGDTASLDDVVERLTGRLLSVQPLDDPGEV
jgi:hypothetical protein